MRIYSTACYSTVDDLACRENNTGNANDQIFYRQGCIDVNTLCGGQGLVGVNAAFCRNATTGMDIPINEIFTRILSTEEFF